MIIELKEVNYRDSFEAISTIKSMLGMIEGTVEVACHNGEPMTFVEAFEYQLKEIGEYIVLANLPSFTESLETLKIGFEAFCAEMLRLYSSDNIEDLRNEAVDSYGGAEWSQIDSMVDLYKSTVNGKTSFFEIFK